jgi:predicted Ser/Thr protein kinase
MDDTRVVAQGGLGILYKGEWRGCEVAIKKPVDPRAAMDASLKEDFEREVGSDKVC